MALFRKEAINHQSQRLTGNVTLIQPLSMRITVSVIVLFAVLLSTFLVNADYSRKATVRGFLMPDKGVIKSFAIQGGTVEQLHVSEGESVVKGQALFTMLVKQTNVDGVNLNHQLQQQLSAQLTLLDDEINQYQRIHSQELRALESKLLALHSEEDALQKQLIIADEQLALLMGQSQRITQLNEAGHISKFEQESRQQSLLAAQQDKQNITRLLLQQHNQISQINLEHTSLPQQYQVRINTLLREKAALENQLSQVKTSHRYSVTASHAGTITGIQVVVGETISASSAAYKPLLTILPKDSVLVAELLLPTRSAGFVAEGQLSRLRFDAFPYQRFGFVESNITRIDKALVTPNEAQLPIALNEPVYRLRASLSNQSIRAYGQEFTLKSGMLFEADILLEQRSLLEWLLEPIYSLNGRVG